MKNIVKVFLPVFIALLCSCDDPYENSTYQVYEVNPVSTYLETRSDEFSEWITVLKYADLFNAINQATELFTAFVPDNDAVQSFYKKKGVNSIQELGYEYARNLAQYHLICDSISMEKFIVGGKLETKTLSEDYLSVSFDESSEEGGGFNSIYVNDEARVKELAVQVSNGYVYVLNAVLSPLLETVYDRINDTNKPYSIFREALIATSWKDSLSVIADTIRLANGGKRIEKRNYTLLAVTDDVFRQAGISSVNDLKTTLNAGTDLTNSKNELFRYVAYHIIEGTYYQSDLQKFDADANKSIRNTKAANEVIQISLESDNVYYLNYDGSTKAMFVKDNTDVLAKNGIVHQLSYYLPVWQPEPATLTFDFCNYPVVGAYIASNGTEGQIYQTVNATLEYRTEVTKLSCYQVEISPSGVGSLTSYNHVDYSTAKATNNFNKCKYSDMLIVNIGYMGTISMQTPVIIKGKYKVTLQIGYATSQDFMRKMTGGSNGGQMKLTFDNENSKIVAPYIAVPANTLDVYQTVVYDELEFTATSTHDFKIVVMDPAASTNASFRLQLDYLLFEPVK